MDPYAIATCVLSVDVSCNACKMSVLEVLGSICGEYNVDIDADKDLVYVYGVVDPNFLMKALSRTGYHAKLKRVNLHHSQARRSLYDYRESHSYGCIDDPYYRLPYSYGSIDDPYNRLSYGGGYHSINGGYYNGPRMYGPPLARYVPSYPPREYDPYDDEPSISLCSIM